MLLHKWPQVLHQAGKKVMWSSLIGTRLSSKIMYTVIINYIHAIHTYLYNIYVHCIHILGPKYVCSYLCCILNSSTISAAEEGSLDKLYQKFRDWDRKMKNIERLHSITSRWSLNSPEYLMVKRLLESRNRANWLLKLESLARERWFLLSLKAKYASNYMY